MKRAVAGSAARLTTVLAHLAALTDCGEKSQSSSAAPLHFCTSPLLPLSNSQSPLARAAASQNGEPRLKACRRPRRDTGPYCPAAVVIYSFCFCSRSNKHNAYDTTSILRCLPPSLRLSCCLASLPPPSAPHACTQSLSRSNKHLHLPHILTNISGKHRA